MHLVEHDPLHLPNYVPTSVQHRPKHLRRHHDARTVRIDGRVARHQSHVAKLFAQFAKLLITQRLERRRVDHSLFISKCHRNRILRDHRLPRRRVRGDEHALVSLEHRRRRALKRIQLERVRLGRRPLVPRIPKRVHVTDPIPRRRHLVHARRASSRARVRGRRRHRSFLALLLPLVVSLVAASLRRLARALRVPAHARVRRFERRRGRHRRSLARASAV